MYSDFQRELSKLHLKMVETVCTIAATKQMSPNPPPMTSPSPQCNLHSSDKAWDWRHLGRVALEYQPQLMGLSLISLNKNIAIKINK